MAVIAELLARLGLDPRDFNKKLKQSEKTLKKTAEKFQSIGRDLTIGVTAPLVGVAAVAIKSFASFDSAMVKSTAIMGDVTHRMDELSGAALDVAKNTTFGADEAAEAFFFLASAGLSVDESLSSLPRVAAFAQAGMFDLAQATDLLTDAQSALGLSVGNNEEKLAGLTRVSDVLVKANTIANASVQQFSESLTNQAGTAAKSARIEIEEVVAVLAAFADQGIKGAEAGTKFAIVVRDLSTKAAKNAKIFEQFGIRVFNAAGNLRPLSMILKDIERRLGSAGIETQKLAFQQLGFADRSIGALQALIGLSGQIEDYERQLKSAGGITDEVAQKQLQSFSAQMKLMKNSIEEVFISLGEELIPVIRDDLLPIAESVIEFFSEIVEIFSQLDGTTKRVVLGMIGFAAAIGPAAIAIGVLLKVTAALGAILSGPAIGLIVIGGGLLTGLGLLAVQGEKAAAGVEKIKKSFEDLDERSQAFVDSQKETERLAGVYEKLSIRLDALVEKETALSDSLERPFIVGMKAASDFQEEIDFNATLSLVRLRNEITKVSMAMLDIAETPSLVSTGGETEKQVGLIDGMVNAFRRLGEESTEVFAGIKAVGQDSFGGVGQALDDMILTSGEKLTQFFLDIEAKQVAFAEQANQAWSSWLAVATEVTASIKLATLDFFQSFAAGLGDAIAQIIVFGADAEAVFKSLMKTILAQIISTLVRMLVEFVIASIARMVLGTIVQSLQVAQAIQLIYLATYASISAIPIIGPALAPAAASAAAAAAGPLSATAGAAGGGFAIAALDTGGLIMEDGLALVHSGERVLTDAEVKSVPELSGSDGMMQVIVELDGRVLTQKIVPRIPHELRMRGL